jgi:glycosyltransferase involved in cell wall biosynthesis
MELRLGLNLMYLQERSGGAGRYARELIPALLACEPELRVTAFHSADAPDWIERDPWAAEVERVRFAVRPSQPGPRSMAGSLAAQWVGLPALAARRRLDVLHGLANVVPPVAPRTATVATILDLTWMRHPGTMGRRGTLGMRVATPVSGRTADRVIAISAAAREDIVASVGVPVDRIDVTPLGVRVSAGVAATSEATVRSRFGLGPGPIVLCAAQLRSHKNLDGLVAAHARLCDREARLVLIGPDGGQAGELLELARRLGTADRVHLTGWVSEADLEGLYRCAACFVLPSFEEGFGLPILEAMARGVPVACSDASSLPEVAGDAALLFDPSDPGSIARAVDRLLGDADLCAELARRGHRRCATFTWTATAAATLASYRAALERPRRLLTGR